MDINIRGSPSVAFDTVNRPLLDAAFPNASLSLADILWVDPPMLPLPIELECPWPEDPISEGGIDGPGDGP